MAGLDRYLVRTWVKMGAQFAINDTHWIVVGEVGTGATGTEIAIAVDTAQAALYKAAMANIFTYWGVTAQKVYPLPRGVQRPTIASRGVGSRTDPPLPPQVAGLITFKSLNPAAGAGDRRRIYYSGMDINAMNTDGTMEATYIGRMEDLAGALAVTLTAGSSPNTSDIRMYALDGAGQPWTINNIAVNVNFSQQKRRSFLRHGDVGPF